MCEYHRWYNVIRSIARYNGKAILSANDRSWVQIQLDPFSVWNTCCLSQKFVLVKLISRTQWIVHVGLILIWADTQINIFLFVFFNQILALFYFFFYLSNIHQDITGKNHFIINFIFLWIFFLLEMRISNLDPPRWIYPSKFWRWGFFYYL